MPIQRWERHQDEYQRMLDSMENEIAGSPPLQLVTRSIAWWISEHGTILRQLENAQKGITDMQTTIARLERSDSQALRRLHALENAAAYTKGFMTGGKAVFMLMGALFGGVAATLVNWFLTKKP